MHKSKNYDMATEVAMDKLMPKPIQITISMQGGGGLRGLGERPISSVYGRPIPRTIYRQGGGGWGYTQEDVETMQASPSEYMSTDYLQQDNPNTVDMLHPSTTRKGWGTGKGISHEERTPLTGSYKDYPYPSDPGETEHNIWNRIQQNLRLQGPPPALDRLSFDKWTPKEQEQWKDKNLHKFGIYDESMPWGKRPESPWVDKWNSPKPESFEGPMPVITGAKKEPMFLTEEGDLPSVISDPDFNDPMEGSLYDQLVQTGQFKSVSDILDFIHVMKSYGRKAATGGKVMPGGLSGIKKSMNINGQPHKLAWINPGEASALKAMGGSGKKVGGVPAYFVGGWGTEDTGVSDIGGEGQATEGTRYTYEPTAAQPSEEATIYPPTRGEYPPKGFVPEQGGGWGYTEEEVGRMQKETPQRQKEDRTYGTTEYDEFIHQKAYSEQGLPRLTLEDLQEGNYDRALIPFINQLSTSSLGRKGAYNALLGIGPKGIQDLINAYHTGYTGGSALETYKNISKDIGDEYISELGLDKIKLTGKETEEEIEKIQSNLEEQAKRLGGTYTRKKAFDTGGIYGGMPEGTAKDVLSVVGPGGLASTIPAHLANFMTDISGHLGTFTTSDGKTFSVRDYGDLVEKDIYTESQSDNDPMPSIKKRRPRPVAQPSTSEPEDDAPAKGTMAELLARRGPAATRAEGLRSLTREGGPLSQVYTKKQIKDFNLA